MSKYVFFWGGPFSQWATSPFTIGDQVYNTAEQWMMWNKATMFGDEHHAKKIMETTDPAVQKRAGRLVENFNDAAWMEKAYDIVVEGTRAKFEQNPEFLKALLATKGKLIVEASPSDKRWGIGMGVGDEGIEDPSNWKGENLLGKACTQVRIEMIGE